MQHRFTFSRLFAGLIIFMALGCPEDTLKEIAPRIAVSVCETPVVQVDGKVLGGVDDCAVAFGVSDISSREIAEIVVSNPSSVELVISSVELSEDTDPAFRVDLSPESIGPGLSGVVQISFRPNFETEIIGQLSIFSNAKNLGQGDAVVIELTGTGVDNGLPSLQLVPESCDFGNIAVGGIGQCDIAVKNTGNRALVIDTLEMVPSETIVPPESELEAPFGFFGRPPTEDDAIEPGQELTLALRFTPDALGAFYGQIKASTNDPDKNEVIILLEGVGVDPPLAACAIKTINGEPTSATNEIEPLDDVVLTATGSEASVSTGQIVSYEWAVVHQPGGSNAVLSTPDSVDTGFNFAGRPGIDLAGTYVVRVTVIDDLGTRSINDCSVEFEAIPTDTIHVQLVWDTSYGDMDLHMTQKNEAGEYCMNGYSLVGVTSTTSCSGEVLDCYYGNCKPTHSSPPDWDADGVARSTGDPSLDIDDLSGYGPENINIDEAVGGSYLVGIHHFSAPSQSGGIGNTVRIYLYGQLQAEFYDILEEDSSMDGEFWEVAIIHWPDPESGVPCIEDLSTSDLECPDY
jgi:uncharacterized protein YfaP (DUF2135 family)